MATQPSNRLPTSEPDLRLWLDDLVRRQLEERLHDAFERAADELAKRARGRSPSEAIRRADELREPAAAYGAPVAPMVGSVLDTVAEIFDRIAGAVAPAARNPGETPAPPEVADLPSTLPELRRQSLTTEQAAARLGVNGSRIRQRLLARTLWGFKEGNSWWIPELQFAGDRLVPGIERVFPELRPSVSPVAVARWFVTPWEDLVVDEERELVVSPRTWLLEGRDPEPVAAQARAF